MRDSLTLRLEDGTRVLLRPVRPEDRRRFEQGLALVSKESRKARFLSPITGFTDEQLRYLTEVDQVDHVAWGAIDPDDPDFPGFGVGRYVRTADDPDAAEVGVVVVDEMQGRGLGRLFLALLYVIARDHGLSTLQAMVHPKNDFMTHWLESLGGENHLVSGAYLLKLPVHEDLAAFPDNHRARKFRETVERLQAELFPPGEPDEELVHYPDPTGVDARAALYARYRPEEEDLKSFVLARIRELPLATPTRVLDVGCGPAGIWSGAAGPVPEGFGLTLLDLSPGMLEAARERLAPRRPELVRGDVGALPFADGSFDLATALHMLYDAPDRDAAVREIARVLAPGGTLVTTTNGGRHLAELREVLAGAGVEGEFVASPWHSRFDLDDGAEILRRRFAEVRTVRREGALEVTEVEPLLDYARSLDHVRAQLDEERIRLVRERVRAEIEAKGTFRLTTESGMHVASAPVR